MTRLTPALSPTVEASYEEAELPEHPPVIGTDRAQAERRTIDAALLQPLSPAERAYVTTTLETNVRSGRAGRVMDKMHASHAAFAQFWDGAVEFSPALTGEELWVAYQHRVILIFCADRVRILALDQRSAEAWQALSQQLTGKALRLLTHAGFGAACACDKAAELAQQTCTCLVAHAYPCDIPLDYWLYTILKNVTLQALTRSQDLLDRDPAVRSLDDLEDRGVCVAAHSFMCAATNAGAGDPLHGSAQMDALIQAINRMPSAERRMVVAYSYFADMTDEEIAARLHKSKAVVHILRHRALKQLRSLIEE